MFKEDIFKDAKYCAPCNKFYVTDLCPFCTPKKELGVQRSELGVRSNEIPNSQLSTPNSQPNFKVEELSLEIERLRRENKEKKAQLAKEKELELKFNILADKFEHLRGRGDSLLKAGTSRHYATVPDNGKDTQTKLLKDRVNELNVELERLQQRSEEKDRRVLQSTAEASKLSGVVEQQRDEIERLRFDIQERDRVIMQISLTLSNAISQALTQRGQEKLPVGAGLAPTHNGQSSASGGLPLQPLSRKTLYVVLGCLNVTIIGYLGFALLYKKGIVNLIIEFFKGHM